MTALRNLLYRSKSLVERHGGVVSLMRRLRVIVAGEGVAGVLWRLNYLLGRPVKWPTDLPSRVEYRGVGPASTGDPVAQEAMQRSKMVSPYDKAPPRVDTELLPGVLLVGHPYGILGRGEDIRTAANAFASVDMPFGIRNTFGDYGKEDAVRHKDFPWMEKIGTSGAHKANIFYLNADEMDPAFAHLGADFYQGRYNIACWAWELSKFPDAWCAGFRYVDEVWAPSRFIQQAVSEKAPCPVVWMPLAVEPTESIRLTRDYFGLPDDRFLFLFFFDFRSYVSRKNPQAAIHAFQRAFASTSEHVGLVIKTNGMDLCPDDYKAFLASEVIRDSRIMLIDRVLDDREIKALVRLCDCFVSLHRSEGFGRGLAEAMYFGKPVIATGYSGNLDFMNEMNACLVNHVLIPVEKNGYPFGEGQIWADPDVDMAAWYMRRLVAEPGYAKEKGDYATRYIKRYHGFHAVGTRYRRRLEQLALL